MESCRLQEERRWILRMVVEFTPDKLVERILSSKLSWDKINEFLTTVKTEDEERGSDKRFLIIKNNF